MSKFTEWFDALVLEAECTEDGRLFKAAGFELEPTGGGCTAWRRDVADGCYILVTDSGGTDHRLGESYAADPGRADCWLIGLHRDDGDHSDGLEAGTVTEAIEAAERLDAAARRFSAYGE